MGLVLGVDGGNSKTDVAILDEAGGVLWTHRGPGASFTPDDHDWSVAALDRSVHAAAADAGIDGVPIADAGVFCLAGADLPADDRRILRALRGLGLVADPEQALPKPLYLRGPDARPQDRARLPRR